MNIINKIQKIKKPNSTVSSNSIINLQQQLTGNKKGSLPEEFVNFLHIYNGINYNGGVICGIYSYGNLQDISTINETIKHPLHKDLSFLGYDDFDYLAYNQKYKVYQIIDKSDLEVLEEYSDFSSAAQHILKINDE